MAVKVKVHESWIDKVEPNQVTLITLDAYPDETVNFLKEEGDPFSNPVGAGLRQGLADIVDALAHDAGDEVIESALDRVIRVRAVQDFQPSETVGASCWSASSSPMRSTSASSLNSSPRVTAPSMRAIS